MGYCNCKHFCKAGFQVVGGSKYQQLLAVIEELGKDIRPTYTGNKICAERLKRSIAHSRILVRWGALISLDLPQNPAFVLSTQFNVLVSTYQLEGACSRIGSIYILSHDLDIIRCIVAPAGVFRFELLDSDVVIAAVTDGSLFITTFNG
ncbi:unnamed protein product [Angiostrongylus costaricensis]|uniref:WD repeat-containing protein 7 n=1 Tax=Angiostrongylus costaricensis TaxID=334426 RepID=A0A0R3PVT9_ANGCS|nr:unnamed protein product [Angiostrongylus costaricensis]